jgi:hypothetical protein
VKPGSRAVRVGCVSALLLAVVVLGACIWRESRRGWTVANLERLVQAEVPLGCDRRHAEVWFDKHNIEHSFFADTTGDRSGMDTMPLLAGMHDDNLSGMVRGWIEGPEANVGFGQSGRITVYFFFDMQGRCAGHLVFPFVYSL